jgi:hypothetical protein
MNAFKFDDEDCKIVRKGVIVLVRSFLNAAAPMRCTWAVGKKGIRLFAGRSFGYLAVFFINISLIIAKRTAAAQIIELKVIISSAMGQWRSLNITPTI